MSIKAFVLRRRAIVDKPNFKKRIVTTDDEYRNILNLIRYLSNKVYDSKEYFLNEVKMGINEKEWIANLLNSSLREDYLNNIETTARYLLNSFVKSLKTSSKTEGKFVILILLNNELYLIHSGTDIPGLYELEDKIDIGKPILSHKNIKKIAKFYKEKTKKEVAFRKYDVARTKGFHEFLGIEEEGIIEAGDVKIIFTINNIPVSLVLPLEKFFNAIKTNQIQIDVKNNMISFHKENDKNRLFLFPIEKACLEDTCYKKLDEFLSNTRASYLKLDELQENFKSIINKIDNYMGSQLIQTKDCLYEIKNGEQECILSTTREDFHIICAFSNQNIKINMDPAFLSYLSQKYIEGNQLKLFFITQPYYYIPLELGSLQIYNQFGISDDLIKLLNKISRLTEAIIDRKLVYMMRVALFELFIDLVANKEAPYYYFFKEFCSKIKSPVQEILNLREDIIELEDIIEYKARDFFMGRDKQIIEKLISAIQSKMKDKEILIMYIGIDENERKVDPIPKSRISDDRLKNIEKTIKQTLNLNTKIVPIMVKDGVILMIIIYK